jgi:dihydroorotate dehydrogenase electron transfer subunit
LKKLLVDAVVISNEAVIPAVWKMVLWAPEIALCVQPGQFVAIRKSGGITFLRRPFSVADADPEQGTITLIYRLVGQGTAEMAAMHADEHINVEGPLGTGFSIRQGDKALLVGGGVGIAPLIFLARKLDRPVLLIGGKTAEETFWSEFLEPYAEKIYITTDDGSVGRKGFTVQALPDILAENEITGISTCGPMIMMQGVAEIAAKEGIPCEVSMEKRMACSIGVCLGCTFAGKSSGKRYKVCADGPVFPAEEVF